MSDRLDLDDAQQVAAADPAAMLAGVLSAAEQIRSGLAAWPEHSLISAPILDRGPVRNLLFAGMGGSAMSGDVVRTMAADAPFPITGVRGYALPSWVGPDDLVVAVSCSGATEETLAIADQAQERGVRWMAIAAGGSPLAQRASDAGVPFLQVDNGTRAPRASLWALTIPALGVAELCGAGDLLAGAAAWADAIDAETTASGPDSATDGNPAKQLALSLLDHVPMIWGTTPLTAVGAYRFMAQLAENADQPAAHGELPEANHNQVVVLDGTSDQARAVALVLLRDADEHPQVRRRAEVSAQIARDHGLTVIEFDVDGATASERFARGVHRIDLATVYLALLLGVDPSGIAPITLLKQRIAQ
jgi:glucose/mannose-6-phosphate isomerase